MTASNYKSMLFALLPRGPLFDQIGQTFSDLLDAISQEFARLELRAWTLFNESLPSKINETLAEYEADTGLPDDCVGLASTVSVRRANVVAKLTGRHGQDKQYYIDVAATIGYTITIDDLMAYESGHYFNGVEITQADWVFVWRVNAAATTIQSSYAGQMVAGDPLRSWGNSALECVINKIKPAHTLALYSYT